MIPRSFSVHATYWHFMKTSCSSWGAWMMRLLFEIRASTESARTHIHRHTKQRITHNLRNHECFTHNAILLVILYSSIITSKCDSGCIQLHVKRLCLECYLFLVYHTAFHVLNGSDSHQWEITALLPCQIPADSHIWGNICIHPPLVLLPPSQGEV